MTDRIFNIGIVGTFDVENYGDLLFPIIAQAELSKRLGPVKVSAFSYNSKQPPEWPYAVTSVTELPRMASSLDGLLIGGGFIIRFDKYVAPGYGPPTASIHHPTGYWLSPALIALQHAVPVIWNSPGMHCNEIPHWAEPFLKLVLKLSSYISVRDEASSLTISPFSGGARIAVTPDTGFGISRLIDEKRPTEEFANLRKALNLTSPYIVVQPVPGIEPYLNFLKSKSHMLRDYRFLALPIGPVLGDEEAILDGRVPNMMQLSEWPQPLLLAEIISHASAVIGLSYHLAITALASGVPVFSIADLTAGKFVTLSDFKTLYSLSQNGQTDLEWFVSRLGKTTPSREAVATVKELTEHWDSVAEVIRNGPSDRLPEMNQFWQSLPNFFEHSDVLLDEAWQNIEERDARLASLGEELTQRDNLIARMQGSPSWRVTAPARFLMRNLKRLRRSKTSTRVMDLVQIRAQQMESEPYAWARIANLFTPEDSGALAATFPTDNFKTVTGYGGEKDYAYEARSLIAMGANKVANAHELSDVWLALARDFLSRDYRNAISSLTGHDLSWAPLEVNVFHYGPRALLGPHPDLPDKLVTHVLYFNTSWNPDDGGCLLILRSSDPSDVTAEIPPIVATSAVMVRSDNSWHAVSPVVPECQESRRSLTATFYRPGSVSTLWPPGEAVSLHRFDPEALKPEITFT